MLTISYFKRKDKFGSQWIFPEKADIQATKVDQIITIVDKVAYQCTIRIKCIIEKDIAESIERKIKEFKQ